MLMDDRDQNNNEFFAPPVELSQIFNDFSK
jgi:hypothetical protein